MGTTVTGVGVDAARELTAVLLEGLGDRWRHTVGVARRAEELAMTVEPADREILVTAAWLHDIGYSDLVRCTGCHSIDGARYLGRRGWPVRICALVAHHSGAEFVVDACGLGAALHHFPHERSPVSDALTYADQTTDATGQRLPIRDRMAQMLARHGPDSAQAAAHPLREPFLLAVAARVEHRLLSLTG